MTTTTMPAREDLESRALSQLTDDQAFASFYRWQGILHGARPAPSLKDQLNLEQYVAAIYEKVPQ